MENSTATVTMEASILKKVDESDVMGVAYEAPVVAALMADWIIPLERTSNLLLKRVFDLLVSTLLLLFVFSWLLPILALIIKLDSKGPVFFIQKRNKRRGGCFNCIKFRTMVINPEADHLPSFDDDHRITKVGRFLRNHHLDELPQLINVWVGHMSVIGPRPHMVSDNMKFDALLGQYSYRHKVKPGITGLAQVLGYVGPITTIDHIESRLEKDIWYINNWSPGLDMKIIYRTVFKMVGVGKTTLAGFSEVK